MAKIMIVEQDSALTDALQYNLVHQDYEVCTVQAFERVVDTMADELVALAGTEVYVELRRRL